MDTLQLGFTLNEHQEDSRWIKEIFPFVHVKNEDLFPHHQIDIGPLVESLAEPGEHFIVTCTCGYPECGGIWTGIRVDHDGDLIRWTVKEPEPGISLAFSAAQYKRAIFRLIDDLALIVQEPDGYNEYGFHGFDHQRFMEIAQRRTAIGQFTIARACNLEAKAGRMTDMGTIALPVEFIGDPPEQFQSPGDILLPPDNLQVGWYVRFERIDNGRIQMHSVKPETRWAQEQPLYQVERAEDNGGYRLRQISLGGLHAISSQALRRISGHGRTVKPSEAFGLLIGWPERREVLAALPVGRTHVLAERSDLFEGIERALAPAGELAALRGLSVMGLYCASADWRGFRDISSRVPACLADAYLMVVPGHGCCWNQDILTRPAPPHGRLHCPWRFSHRRIDSAGINPRRIHSEWIKLFGPMDLCEDPAPAATGSASPSASPVRDWFTAERLPVDIADIPPVWNRLPEAIEAASQVRIRYAGGSLPGGERLIRPLALFRVEGYDATYLQAIDTDLEAERVFRLDRMEPVAAPHPGT